MPEAAKYSTPCLNMQKLAYRLYTDDTEGLYLNLSTYFSQNNFQLCYILLVGVTFLQHN